MNSNVSVSQKIQRCQITLEEWGKSVLGTFQNRIKSCKDILQRLKGERDRDSVVTYENAHKQLMEILQQKEIYWRQRSKQIWLQSGDNNTKNFHSWASVRRKTNLISELYNADGRVVR